MADEILPLPFEPRPQGKRCDAGDILIGASAITEFVNELTTIKVSRSQIYHWIETRTLPAGRLGTKLIGSKKRIR